MKNVEVNEYLSNYKGTDFFDKIDSSDYHLFEIVSFSMGTEFIKEKSLIDGAYFLMEGNCAVVKTTLEGNFVKTFSFEAFDFIGFYEFVAKIPRYLSSVICNTNCVLIKIKKTNLSELFAKYPSLERHILVKVIERCYARIEWHILMGNKPIKERLMNYLYVQIPTNFFVYNQKFINIESRAEIANAIGCEIRSLSRVLNQLKEEGYISVEHKMITINKNQYKLF